MRALLAISSLIGCIAPDPAEGWMAYAVGSLPSSAERITKLEMTWTVNSEAKHSLFVFYSPWFGMDPADNLNLLQPVNPWSGSSWSMYTEYFQWRPIWNHNSKRYSVEAGQTLHGSIVWDETTDSYNLSQTIVETGQTSSQVVKAQKGKKFVLPYVVFEKTFACKYYPPEGKVTFRNIIVECDGQDCTPDVKWRTDFVDDHCNMRAHVDKANLGYDSNEISITWDTTAASKYDNHTVSDLLKLNAGGWGQPYAESALKALEVTV
jgi:hypothetical protein